MKLNLKANHKVLKDYYAALNRLGQLDMLDEGNVAPAFATVLRYCARQFNWTLVEQYPLQRKTRLIRPDGALVDQFKLLHGFWEAKDTKDDLHIEVKKKFALGYPNDNIIFQAPDRAIIVQNNREEFNDPIDNPDHLIEALNIFFLNYRPPQHDRWEQAVDEFKERVPELGKALLDLIEQEIKNGNKRFVLALEEFTDVCRSALNPNLSRQAVEEMLIQHILTERLFRKVFNNPDFATRNIIAHEIENVVNALTSKHFSRDAFLGRLDRFYVAIEDTAATITEYSEKQSFLNTVYEKFFQGFSVKVADTMGIVYTPQPISRFMVNSVEFILQAVFGRSLSDKGVPLHDPFVGTGNFPIHLMRKIKKTSLAYKFEHELHCNEIMLLPYYIASMNIEHEFVELTGEYKPFEGICLVDTFELAESHQTQLAFMTAKNTERVERLKRTPIFVEIGNPPYNVGQVNENDNNKNRKYPVIDGRVRETYARDSKATNKNALSDVYVKAFRWASDKIIENGEGIVAFITNNSYIQDFAFDGMRKHLAQDFDLIYVLDLKGNIRKDSMKDGIPLGEKHTVFGLAAMVGIAVIFLVKNPKLTSKKICYSSVDFRATRAEKFDFIEKVGSIENIQWTEVIPDANHTWLIEGLSDDFASFAPMGTKDAKAGLEKSIFQIFSNGVKTNRDQWTQNFNSNELKRNIKSLTDTYNHQAYLYHRQSQKPNIDAFVENDDKKISWSEGLKNRLKSNITIEYLDKNIRQSLYRPFCRSWLYFDKHLCERRYQFHKILPNSKNEIENKVICLSAAGSTKPFHCILTNIIPDIHLTGDSQCFPFYTYDEDGSNRRDNITDWALDLFREHYKANNRATHLQGVSHMPHSKDQVYDRPIEKWDIFYYIYGLLHHPLYREKYQANLRRELPRIPCAPDFWAFSAAGKKLAHLHVYYEQQVEYPLEMIETEGQSLDWRVEKMRLSKDKAEIKYNDFLTLRGIPPETFNYRLGNRSALDWIVDQYRFKQDPRSGILNDPNRPDEPDYIVKLIKKIVTVSLETVKIVESLPDEIKD